LASDRVNIRLLCNQFYFVALDGHKSRLLMAENGGKLGDDAVSATKCPGIKHQRWHNLWECRIPGSRCPETDVTSAVTIVTLMRASRHDLSDPNGLPSRN